MRLIALIATALVPFSSAALDCSNTPHDLADMVAVDQALRFQLIEILPTLQPGEHPRLADHLAIVDRSNTDRLRAILRHCGWPKASVFGPEAGQNAWLLAQHADHNLKFQLYVLRLLSAAVRASEASGENLAYLADRVAVAQGKKQLYGTQFNQPSNCAFELEPVDDIRKVEARRKDVGLPTLAEYRRQMEDMLAPQCKNQSP
jgi:hypothetical protein